jgi:hypothetical protein
MKLLLILSLLYVGCTFANPEIQCVFSEPDKQVFIDLETNTLTVNSNYAGNSNEYIEISPFGLDELRIYAQNTGELLMKIYPEVGDDNMSDYIYPLSAKLNGHIGGRGGCNIGKFRAFSPFNVYSYIIENLN